MTFTRADLSTPWYWSDDAEARVWDEYEYWHETNHCNGITATHHLLRLFIAHVWGYFMVKLLDT